MKKLFAATAIALPVLLAVPVVVSAQEDVEPVREATSESRQQTREERVQTYKDRATEALSEAESRRVAGVCQAAQTIVARLQSNIETAIENRSGKYASISSRLAEITAQLQAANIDTTALDAVVAEMNTQAAALNESMQAYQTTITDLAELDCAADPDAFKAALEAARSQRSALIEEAQALKSYVQESVKAALTEIRATLAEQESTEGSEEN